MEDIPIDIKNMYTVGKYKIYLYDSIRALETGRKARLKSKSLPINSQNNRHNLNADREEKAKMNWYGKINIHITTCSTLFYLHKLYTQKHICIPYFLYTIKLINCRIHIEKGDVW